MRTRGTVSTSGARVVRAGRGAVGASCGGVAGLWVDNLVDDFLDLIHDDRVCLI